MGGHRRQEDQQRGSATYRGESKERIPPGVGMSGRRRVRTESEVEKMDHSSPSYPMATAWAREFLLVAPRLDARLHSPWIACRSSSPFLHDSGARDEALFVDLASVAVACLLPSLVRALTTSPSLPAKEVIYGRKYGVALTMDVFHARQGRQQRGNHRRSQRRLGYRSQRHQRRLGPAVFSTRATPSSRSAPTAVSPEIRDRRNPTRI